MDDVERGSAVDREALFTLTAERMGSCFAGDVGDDCWLRSGKSSRCSTRRRSLVLHLDEHMRR
jgi:hypothetical protein